MLGSFDKISSVSSVCINSLYPRESCDQQSYKSVSRFGIMNIRRSRCSFENVSVLVSYYIAFHSFNFLIAIDAFLRTRQCRARTLTVNGSYGGRFGFATSESYFLYKVILKLSESIHSAPASEVVVDNLPLRIFRGKQTPLATAHIDVDDCVKYEREFGIRMTTSMRPQIDINHRAIRKGSPDDFIGTVYCQRTSCPFDSGTS